MTYQILICFWFSSSQRSQRFIYGFLIQRNTSGRGWSRVLRERFLRLGLLLLFYIRNDSFETLLRFLLWLLALSERFLCSNEIRLKIFFDFLWINENDKFVSSFSTKNAKNFSPRIFYHFPRELTARFQILQTVTSLCRPLLRSLCI